MMNFFNELIRELQNSNGFMIVGFVMVTIGFLIVVGSSISAADLEIPISGIFILIMGVLVISVGMVVDSKESKEEKAEIIETVQEDVENGYKLYIDGQEVDIDTINLNNYGITIKDDEKIVILSKK